MGEGGGGSRAATHLGVVAGKRNGATSCDLKHLHHNSNHGKRLV